MVQVDAVRLTLMEDLTPRMMILYRVGPMATTRVLLFDLGSLDIV